MPQEALLAPYLRLIQKHHPELEIRSARIDPEGLANDVVIVNEDLVFRFPRTEGDLEQLKYEVKLLGVLRSHFRVPIPVVEEVNEDYALQGYLPGLPLYRHSLLRYPPAAQDAYAAQLTGFLKELHSIPLDKVPNPPWLPEKVTNHRRKFFLEQLPKIQAMLYPVLWSDQRAWVEDLFAGVHDRRLELDNFIPCLTHRDLAVQHILHNPQLNTLTGVIDFGTAASSDPAEDLGMIISLYGEGFLKRMRDHYPLEQEQVDRARFYAAYLELEWALRGVQNQNLEWLVANIGRARDSQPIFTNWD